MNNPLLTFVLLILAACSSTTGPAPSAPLNQDVRIKYGETILFANYPVTFVEVEDSRCPSTVTCAWAGDAAVSLRAESISGTLHTNRGAGSSSAVLGPVTVTLKSVQPQRVGTEAPRKSDYVAMISVTRTPRR